VKLGKSCGRADWSLGKRTKVREGRRNLGQRYDSKWQAGHVWQK